MEKYICISITILFPANVAIVIAMHFASIVNKTLALDHVGQIGVHYNVNDC